MMSNAILQSMFEEFGDRICAISMNNNKMMFIDYSSKASVRLSDISFETRGGCDFMVVKRKDISSGRDIYHTDYIVTEFVENVIVMDEGYEKYRVDPLLIK